MYRTTQSANGEPKRLCRSCARERSARYLTAHPERRRRYLPLPALPEDAFERDLERTIRWLARSPRDLRAPQVWAEVESRLPPNAVQPVGVELQVRISCAANPLEGWGTFAARVRRRDQGAWLVSRLLADPRIQQILERGRSPFRIIALQDGTEGG